MLLRRLLRQCILRNYLILHLEEIIKFNVYMCERRGKGDEAVKGKLNGIGGRTFHNQYALAQLAVYIRSIIGHTIIQF